MSESPLQRWLLLGATLCLAGCAGVEGQFLARPFDAAGQLSASELTPSGLRVSGGELEELSSPHLGAVQVVFENQSAEWVRVRDVRLRFGATPDQDAAVHIPHGSDLGSWYEATLQRNAVREHNRAAALGLVALSAATVAVASNDEGVRAASGLVSLGAATALTMSDVKARVDALERPAIYPETHLLSGPFAVPPALFVKKWITLGTQRAAARCVGNMVVSYRVEGRAREHVLLRFKVDSEWQRESCRSLFRPGG